MPTSDEARESIRARIKNLRKTDKRPPAMALDDIYGAVKKGRNVFLVFDSNADRLKYQQRILQGAVDFLHKDPLGGMPKGSLAGERVFQWPNGAEIAFSTAVPGDPKGNLFYEVKPPDTDVVRPDIPESWNKKTK